MRITLIAVGTKMPRWVQEAVEEYAKRIQKTLGFSILEIPLAQRSKSTNAEQCIDKEGAAIIGKINSADYVIALEVEGKSLSTASLAKRLANFKAAGKNIVLLVGGPDGLASACRDRANEQWSLSDLTLPHPLVRILLIEQLYRANSLLEGHPYHRA